MQSKCYYMFLIFLYLLKFGATVPLQNANTNVDTQAKSLGLLGFIKGLQFGKFFQHKHTQMVPVYWQAVFRVEFQPMQFGAGAYPVDCPFGCPYYPMHGVTNGFPVAPPRPKPSYDEIPMPFNDNPTDSKNSNTTDDVEDSDESFETFDVNNAVHQNSSDRIIRNIIKQTVDRDYDEDRTTESDIISTTSYDEGSDQETSREPSTTLTSTLLHPVDSLTDLPTTEYPTNDQPTETNTTPKEILFSSASTHGYGLGAPVEHIFFTTLKPPFSMEPLPVWYSPSVAAWTAFRPSHPEYSGDSNVFLPILTQQ